MTLSITPTYAALLTLIFVTLSWRVISYRRGNSISLGDAGDKNLLKRMRTQANFVEYTPLAILMIALIELQGAPAIAVHVLGLALLAGRTCHPLGFAVTPQRMILRQIGMVLTLSVLVFSALGVLGHAIF